MDCNNLMESMSLSEHTFYKSICATINNSDTEIIFADHSDKILIIATQYQKLGSLLTVTKDQVENFSGISEVVYTVTPISGEENSEQQAATRFIAEKINSDKKLCVFLCLKSYEPKLITVIAEILLKLKNNCI